MRIMHQFRASGRNIFKKLQTNPNRFVAPLCAFLSFFILSFITGSFIIQPQPTKAVTGLGLIYGSYNFGWKSNVRLDITPSSSGIMSAHKAHFMANGYNPKGYSLTLDTIATSPDLPETTGTFATPTPLANNTWGYAVADAGGFDPTYTTPTPSSSSKWANPSEGAIIKQTNSVADNDVTYIYYGAKVDTNQPSGTYTNTVRYTFMENMADIPLPTITNVTPNTGTTAGGTAITIVGTGFTVDDQSITYSVLIDGKQKCTDVSISSNVPTIGQDTIYCNTPAHAVGSARITVYTLGGEASSRPFTYIDPASVTFVSPNQASTIAGTESGPAFTIAGSGFTGATQVTIGGTACASFQIISDTHIFCKAPNTINTTGNKKIAVIKSDAVSTEDIMVAYSNTDYPTFESSNAYTNCTTTATLFRDTRDSQLYYIKRMPDKKCWMVDNLKYANYGTLSQASGKFLTADGTATQSTANSDVAKYVDPNTDSYCISSTNMPTNTNTRCGLLYNWYAATNGTGTYAQSTQGTNVTGSICPANFRLPSAMSDGNTATSNGISYDAADFPMLNASMNAGAPTAGSTDNSYYAGWQPTGTWGGTISGFWRDNFLSMGSFGYFWSSTVHSAPYARYVNFYNGSVGAGLNNNSTAHGFAVRCVMEAPSYNYTYTNAAQTFTAPEDGTYQVELWGTHGAIPNNSYGAYTKGTIDLNKNEMLYVYVGGNTADFYGAGTNPFGSGATDIRLSGGAWDDAAGLRSRIMVAAGGGGGAGGSAGGLTGYPGFQGGTGWPGCNEAVIQFTGGGAQTAGGTRGGVRESNCYYSANTYANDGVFGKGGINAGGVSNGKPWWCGGSGGGGYYGGGGGVCAQQLSVGGGGGSSYISGHTGSVAITSASNQAPKAGCTTGTTNNTCSIHYSGKTFTNTVMIDGAGYNWTNIKGALQAMPSPAGWLRASGIGHSGDGHARITYVSP